MLDLDTELKVPEYAFKYQSKEHTYDALLLSTKLGVLKGENDLQKIQSKASEIFGLPFTINDAILVLKDFEQFCKTHEEALKKVFGPLPSSSTTTGSTQETENAEGSPQQTS